VGGLGTDGASFALEAYNAHFGTNIQMHSVALNVGNIYAALNSGSPINTGIHYGSQYFKNEQDDGTIENTSGTVGNGGHWITIVKLNTTNPNFVQIKYAENYNGVLTYNVIYLQDFVSMRSLFFNGAVFYSGK
jgi:hypothetical protein